MTQMLGVEVDATVNVPDQISDLGHVPNLRLSSCDSLDRFLTWLTMPPRTEPVLGNFDLLGHRYVVPLLVFSLLAEVMLLAEVRGRAET